VERRWQTAIENWRSAGEKYRQALRLEPRQPELLRRIAKVERNLAHSFQLAKDRVSAIRHYAEAQALEEARTVLQPHDAGARMTLSFILAEKGWVHYELHEYKQAVDAYQRAFVLQEALFAADPHDYRARAELAKLMLTAAPAHEGAGERGRAIRLLRTAGQKLTGLLTADTTSYDLKVHLGWAHLNLGDACVRGGDWRTAVRAYQAAAAALRSIDLKGKLAGELDPGPMLAHVEKQLDPRSRQFPPLNP